MTVIRTDAIIAAERMKYGHRLDTPMERGLGRERDRS